MISGNCSFCKESIKTKEIVINQAIQRFVKRSLAVLGPHHLKCYRNRKQQLRAREKFRMANVLSLKIGDYIDYRDSLRMRWYKGNVMRI